jgi:ElaB/YqjD/DUF883 family membrane-anchored ribosome-binding protein
MNTENKLHKEMDRVGVDFETLAKDARALMTATAHVTGDKVEEARQRLEEMLGNGGDLYEGLRDRALRGAKVADDTVREHTYSVIGIAIGAGLLLGLLASHRLQRCA